MIVVHGYLGHLSDELRRDAEAATVVVGGQRHLDALGVPEDKRVVLGRVTPAIERLKQLGDDETGVVIASGDPLFYGIGRSLRRAGLTIQVVTAPSSIAAAFAAVGVPWEDATVTSAHGHTLDATVAACREHRKVAALTAPDRGIRELAAALDDVERWFVLAERLGEADENVQILTRQQALALTEVRQPNVVLVLADHPDTEPTKGAPATAGAAAPAGEGQAAGVGGEPIIGQIVNSPASRRAADAIDAGLGITSRRYGDGAASGLRSAWAECDLIVSHLATGATTRIIAPLLRDKRHDPGVVVVDEASRFAIPLVGGHAGGANDLARRIADALGATPVLTTATDAVNLPALDTLGWAYRGDVAGVTQAIINDRPVQLVKRQPWPMPPLPANVTVDAAEPVARIVLTDEVAEPHLEHELPTVVLHPRSLVVGMGCNSGTSVEHLREHLHATLAQAGLAAESVVALTTHDVKAGELGLVQLAAELGLQLEHFPPEVLAAQDVPTPSATVEGHVGSPSVSEASVLARGASLLVPKQKTSDATCAIGRLPARGKLSVVGLGPGSRDLLSPRAVKALREATFILGYGPYVKQVKDLARVGCEVSPRRMGTEEDRTAEAIARARGGENVCLVCSGDPSVYAMGSPTLQQGTDGIDVDIIPGITAALACSSLLGAPLGHDHVLISLSDLHTPWEVIEKRLAAAAEGDFVVALYNPQSRTRRDHLPRALEILGALRAPTTPIGIVRQAYRPQQAVTMSTLADVDISGVDMYTTVIVGSSTTRFVTTGDGERRMVTPRDYQWMGDK